MCKAPRCGILSRCKNPTFFWRSRFSPPKLRWMSDTIRFRGRDYTSEDFRFIQQLIDNNPGLSRRRLSVKLCEAWNWYQANGATRDMVCRSFMLLLHRAGVITLPPIRMKSHNPLAKRKAPQLSLDLLQWEKVGERFADLKPLEILQVRRSGDEKLFNQLIQSHHYLAYTHPVGEHLKYLIRAKGTPVACMAWCSGPLRMNARDRFIGWTPEVRKRNLHLTTYNTRFLILPWGRVPHLASHILGCVARRISKDWQALYNHPIHLLETFIEPGRFKGTCYKAANWVELGETKGRGTKCPTQEQNRPIKTHWVYPLGGKWKVHLQA